MVLQRITPSSPTKQSRPNVLEVIPDSEEECQQCTSTPLKKTSTSTSKRQVKGDLSSTTRVNFMEVIEISSDSDDSDSISVIPHTPRRPKNVPSRTPRSIKTHYSRSRIIESSDDDSEPEIIELSDSSDEAPFSTPSTSHTQVSETPESPSRKGLDQAIIVFDEPRSARRPLRLGLNTTKKLEGVNHANPLLAVEDDVQVLVPTTPSKKKAPAAKKIGSLEETPRPKGKKAQIEAEQRRRHEYAQQLFTDLNLSVFKQGLPLYTKLNWNKRLLTTAGRAKFHRSRDGVQTTEIELAEKILDCDERIRNTLSHEMCHLATWVIDKKVDEHHGKLFKSWAHKVMLKRPDIHVSVKHNYEISHPFQWKCAKCAKVYGRFSKSIKPSECVCGACKEGTLIPLFPVKAAVNPDNNKLSRMAAAKAQESPRTITHTAESGKVDHPDSDLVDLLASIMASTRLD